MDDAISLETHFSEIAALIGEKARATMLWNLLDGKAYTATELAICADISKQSCSNHLLKLVAANLLIVEKQGRHKYYRFANDKVAQIIEGIAFLAPRPAEPQQVIQHKVPQGMRYARTCYDHLAGKFGVEMTTALLQKNLLTQQIDKYTVTDAGVSWFEKINIDLAQLKQMKRRFAFPCLDWSERKPHIGGALGAALLHTFLANDWIRRKKLSREIVVTGKGAIEINRLLGLSC